MAPSLEDAVKFLSALFLALALNASLAAETPLQLSAAQRTEAGVRVVALSSGGAVMALRANGRAVAPNALQAVVVAPVSGVLTRLMADVPAAVRQDQPLAQLASREGLELRRELAQADAQAQFLAQRVKRDEQLVQEGIVPRARLEDSRAQYAQARALANERRRSARMAGLAPDGAQVDVRAPLDGELVEQLVQPGERLEAGAPIFRLVGRGALWFDLALPPEQAASVRVGDPLQVAGCEVTGRIRSVGGAVAGMSQTVMVRAELPAGCLRPGQYAAATLRLTADGAAVPEEAVVLREGRRYVFVERNGSFVPTALEAGPLPVGARVAVGGLATLKAVWLGVGAQ